MVLLAVLLRFPTLGARGFWVDEAFTVVAVEGDLGRLVDQVRIAERTPPLYDLAAWAWVQLFGVGEVGLRSLSAVLGVLFVPLAYMLGRELVSRRAGVVLAALVATNPFLVWHAQEARAYALLGPLCAAGLLLCARGLRQPWPGGLWAWGCVSLLALATHYFALLAVVPQGVLLAWRWPLRRHRHAVAVAAAGVTVLALGVAVALLTLDPPTWFGATPLLERLVGSTSRFLLAGTLPRPVAVAVAALVAVGLVLSATRTAPEPRRAVRLSAGLAFAAGTPLVTGGVLGLDFVVDRNFLPALVPALVVVAAGLACAQAPRLGAAAAVALTAGWALVVVVTGDRPMYDRFDERTAARALGPAATARVVVFSAGSSAGEAAFQLYLEGARRPQEAAAVVSEVDRLQLTRTLGGGALRRPSAADPPPPPPAPGFRLVGREDLGYVTVLRYRATAPVRVEFRDLCRGVGADGGLLLQPAARREGRARPRFPRGLQIEPPSCRQHLSLAAR